MPFEIILKYGALGICLAALVVTVSLVKQELKRTKPRAAGIGLIAMTMLFCFALIGGAAYIDGRNHGMAQRTTTEVREAASTIDAYLYDKLQMILKRDFMDREIMRSATESICNSVRHILNSTGDDQRARCKTAVMD